MTDVGKHVLEFKNNSGSRRENAFAQLVQRFQDMAVGIAYSMLGDFHIAQDMAQESFLTAYVQIDQLKDPEAFPGWFRQIIVNKCGRLLRQPMRAEKIVGEVDTLPQSGKTPDVEVEARQLGEFVENAIATLPENERIVTILFYLTGYSINQIAELLDVSIPAVKKRLERARKHLKNRIIKMTKTTLQNHKPSKNPSFSELHKAAEKGNGSIAELLLSKGVPVDAQKNTGETALHFAAWGRSREIVKILLAHGADPALSNMHGYTPLDIALFEEGRIVPLPFKKGHETDQMGASEAPDDEIVKMLREFIGA